VNLNLAASTAGQRHMNHLRNGKGHKAPDSRNSAIKFTQSSKPSLQFAGMNSTPHYPGKDQQKKNKNTDP
jgi:hypothetical protein